MRLAPNEYPDPLSDSSLQLLVELVHTDSVAEVEDVIVCFFAFENYGDVEGDKNVIVRRTGSHREPINNILLRDQKLDFGPGHAGPDEAAFFLHVVEFAVAGDDCVGAFRPIFVLIT
jgi:hypothetical protein